MVVIDRSRLSYEFTGRYVEVGRLDYQGRCKMYRSLLQNIDSLGGKRNGNPITKGKTEMTSYCDSLKYIFVSPEMIPLDCC
jgi:hypothetical protein